MALTPLDQEEINVLANTSFYEAKARLDLKVRSIFDELQTGLCRIGELNAAKAMVPAFPAHARFYQGEHHHGFPWRAFDHFADIKGKDMFIFRSVLLYGQAVGLHLVLTGAWADALGEKIRRGKKDLEAMGFTESIQGDIWDWRNAPGTYQAVSGTPQSVGSIKLSIFFPTNALLSYPENAMQAWAKLLPILFPQGESVP
jgi:hypothetical protein